VPTLDGPEEIDIKAGTQSGEVRRLKGRGMPRLRGGGRGELIALLKVETPTDLTAEQAELLQKLAEMRDEEVDEGGFFKKIREAFS
jgi:molecular chaperone DnaJ